MALMHMRGIMDILEGASNRGHVGRVRTTIGWTRAAIGAQLSSFRGGSFLMLREFELSGLKQLTIPQNANTEAASHL